MALAGDTVRVIMEFRNFDSFLIDPTSPVLRVRDPAKALQSEVALTRSSLGIYYCDLTVPLDARGPLTLEAYGIIDGTPKVDRVMEPVTWAR